MSSQRPATKAYSFLMFLVVSALAGVLVAGLAVPAVAAVGASGTAVSALLTDLPEYLVTVPQPEGSTIYLADGSVLAQEYQENRTIVTLDQIAPVMQQAQIAIEDHRFYDHGPLDFNGLIQAVLTNLPGGSSGRGGSTLTQQYVKQARIEAAQAETGVTPEQRAADIAAATANNLSRKIVEMRYAIGVEKQLTKDQILNNYLNIAYYGDHVYGVEAAAYHYFGTTAANLTLPQAAMLAGIVQTPSRNPIANLASSLDRRNVVLDQMALYGYITQAQADEAKKATFDPSLVQHTYSGCANSRYPFYCSFVEGSLTQSTSLPGSTVADKTTALQTGGYDIYTSLDPTKQDAVQASVNAIVGPTDPVVAVSTSIQPGTGLVLAMAQSRPYGNDDTNPYVTGYNDATEYGYQSGSTFKAFTAVTALSQGISPSRKYNATPTFQMQGKVYELCTGPSKAPNHIVKNSTGSGVMDMFGAAANSVNTYFIQLEQATGVCAVATMARTLGVQMQTASGKIQPLDPNAPNVLVAYTLTLGVIEVTPLSMADAYATFAARGVHCDPIAVTRMTDRDGVEVAPPSANCQQVIDPGVADGVNKVLSGIWHGTGASLGGLHDGRDAAGKTGTTENAQAVWFMGYTPDVVTQAMIAQDRGPLWQSFWDAHPGITGLRLSTGRSLAGFGSTDAGRIWKPAMEALIVGVPPDKFTPPPASVLNGKNLAVPSTAGMTDTQATAVLQKAGFLVSTGQAYSDTVPAGTFMGASCDGRSATCTLNYSQGPRPA